MDARQELRDMPAKSTMDDCLTLLTQHRNGEITLTGEKFDELIEQLRSVNRLLFIYEQMDHKLELLMSERANLQIAQLRTDGRVN